MSTYSIKDIGTKIGNVQLKNVGLNVGGEMAKKMYLGDSLVYQIVSSFPVGTVRNFLANEDIALPSGIYKLEVWSAQGGDIPSVDEYKIEAKEGRLGGYVKSLISFDIEKTLKVSVGASGQGVNATDENGVYTIKAQYGGETYITSLVDDLIVPSLISITGGKGAGAYHDVAVRDHDVYAYVRDNEGNYLTDSQGNYLIEKIAANTIEVGDVTYIDGYGTEMTGNIDTANLYYEKRLIKTLDGYIYTNEMPFPSINGGLEIGHHGDGYARITRLPTLTPDVKHFAHGETYNVGDIVECDKHWFTPKHTTSNAPYHRYTTNDGNLLTYNDGGWLLSNTVNTDDYIEL